MKNRCTYFLKKVRETHMTPLHRGALLGIAVLAGLTFSTSGFYGLLGNRVASMLSAVLPGVIVDLTNDERNERDLSTLSRNKLLENAALLKATHMRDNSYFAHYSPEGISPWHWFDEVGYDYVHAGENLAVFFDDSGEVVQAWMDSPLHRENILKSAYTEIGVAAVEAEHKGYSTVFVVQLFGTPAEKQVDTIVLASREDTESEEKTVEAVRREISAVPEQRSVVESSEAYTAAENTNGIKVDAIPIEEQTVYVSNHAATTTIAAPATFGLQTNVPLSDGMERTFQTLYVLVASIVIGIIMVSIGKSVRFSHPMHTAYSIGLLVLAAGAIALHAHIVGAALLL